MTDLRESLLVRGREEQVVCLIKCILGDDFCYLSGYSNIKPCWLSIISYPTRARGIIVKYYCMP